MACSGAHCDNHYSGCNYHRPPCAANRPLNPRANQGERVTTAHIEDLRTKVQAEIALYRANHNYSWVPMEANDSAQQGVIINENTMFLELDRMMDRVLGWGPGGSIPSQGSKLTWFEYVAVCNEYDIVRTNCICHSDLGVLICTCDGNCGCNYSDMRLKKEVVYC